MPEIEKALNTINEARVKAGDVVRFFLELERRGPYMFNEGKIQEIRNAEKKAIRFISFIKKEILEEKKDKSE